MALVGKQTIKLPPVITQSRPIPQRPQYAFYRY